MSGRKGNFHVEISFFNSSSHLYNYFINYNSLLLILSVFQAEEKERIRSFLLFFHFRFLNSPFMTERKLKSQWLCLLLPNRTNKYSTMLDTKWSLLQWHKCVLETHRGHENYCFGNNKCNYTIFLGLWNLRSIISL